MVTTETALLHVKANYDRQAERDALSTLLAQAGLQAVHRALAEEDSTKLSVLFFRCNRRLTHAVQALAYRYALRCLVERC